jgi:sigma-B regulation protein RsbU (phosphoserine phosphatase)
VVLLIALLLQITRADVGRMLRADSLRLGLGLLLIAVGLAAAAAYLGRLRGEPLLPWFGLFAFLYGLRLLARTSTFPLLFDLPPRLWAYVAAAITYVIPVPAILVLRAAFPRWRRPSSWAAGAAAAFAAGAVAADVILQRPDSARTPNNLIAIAFMVAALVLLFRPHAPLGRELRPLRIGLASLSVTAVVDNLRGLGLLWWPTFEVEPLGATVLIACLGTVAVRRALDNAERLVALDKELGIARRIQSSILPSAMPEVAGLAVAARYHPMTAVAGDFYDFLELGKGRLGILVADVSGHGVPAALIASMVKVAIAAQKAQGDRPAAVLAGMHETLSGRLGGQYVTAAYLFLDRESGVMRYGGAGHPPLLHWRAGEPTARALEENGLPLGLMDVAHYQTLEQPLRVGDRFLLYTDGLVEATNPAGEFFGLEGVTAAVAAGPGVSTDEVADRIVGKTLAWSNGTAADDLTVLLVDCV